MPALNAYSLVQPAVAVRELDVAVDRMHELFLAVPSERNDTREFANAVYAFGNNTYLELLDGRYEGHTRMRFLEQFGPGLYMLCVDIAPAEPAAIEAELAAAGVRVVQKGRETANIPAGWHLHPRDAGGILVLHALKKDLADNSDWAGHQCRAYVPGNSRVISELRGVVARTPDPASEAARFAAIGMLMEPADGGGQRWTGATGTVVELQPPGAWPGPAVDAHRDYALLLAANDPAAVAARLAANGTAGVGTHAGRLMTEVDPVLGVRFAIEPA